MTEVSQQRKEYLCFPLLSHPSEYRARTFQYVSRCIKFYCRSGFGRCCSTTVQPHRSCDLYKLFLQSSSHNINPQQPELHPPSIAKTLSCQASSFGKHIKTKHCRDGHDKAAIDFKSWIEVFRRSIADFQKKAAQDSNVVDAASKVINTSVVLPQGSFFRPPLSLTFAHCS